MEGRFSDIDDGTRGLVADVVRVTFPELVNVKVKWLFDAKMGKSKGKFVFGKCMKSSDVHRKLSEYETEGGYDYIIFLNEILFENIEDEDKIRIIRHELRHIFIDVDSEKTPYKILPHDVEDFMDEIVLNSGDPRWGQRLAAILESLEEAKKDKKR